MPLDDVLYSGQFFNISDKHSEEYYNKKNNLLKSRGENIFDRLHNQTVETVTFKHSSKEVVKEWWVQNPPAVYPLPMIRWILLHRDVARFSQNKFNRSYIPSTVDRRGYDPNRTVGIGFRFQDPRNNLRHPYRLAMAGDDAFKKALDSSDGATWEHKQKVVSSYVGQSSVFAEMSDFTDWFSGAAPKNITGNEMLQWFQ